VFVIGGASYSELRVCREITENHGREVILGSTALISAKDFISDLTKLSQQSLS
jgi:syntaxin-binding protein 1